MSQNTLEQAFMIAACEARKIQFGIGNLASLAKAVRGFGNSLIP